MPNQVVPFPQQQMVDPNSGWVWDGQKWICGPQQGCCPPAPGPWFAPPTSPWYPGANGGISFGNVAPINPVRGHLWWTGTVLALWDGAAWVNTANGGIIVPPQNGSIPPGTGGVIISSTAPGNPVAGMQWWDGSVLRVFDGVQWNIVGPGGAAGPVPTTTRVFFLSQSTTVTIPVNTFAIVPFTSTPFLDSTLGWNATTHMFKPTRAGTYCFLIFAYLQAPGSGADVIELAMNDQGTLNISTQVVAAQEVASGAGVSGTISAMGIALMNGTTDFVRFWAYSGDGNFYGTGLPTMQAWLLP